VIKTTIGQLNSGLILRAGGATVAVAAMTTLLVLFRLNEAAAGLAFLTTVVWFASRAGLGLSLYVAVLCALSFDYFFLTPVRTFRLAGVHQWVEMLSFAISSVVVGRLAERARQQTHKAHQRREDVERLYTLSQDMMLHEDAARLVLDLPRLVERSFALDSVLLYVLDQDQFYASTAEVPTGLRSELRALTAGHSAPRAVIDEYSTLPLMLGLKPIGALAWKPDNLSREVATAVSAQVAIALTRSLAIETYTRIEAARESDRLRTALIDSLTHELRTPLTAIRAAASTLVQGDGLDEVHA
jgi:two-component system sensor histidine kinase KdpD